MSFEGMPGAKRKERTERKCEQCFGSGKKGGEKCKRCCGKGVVTTS